MVKFICMALLYISCVIAILLVLFLIFLPNQTNNCEPSITSASGSAAFSVCSGSLIFVENFEQLDKNKWQPEVTLSGGAVSKIGFLYSEEEISFYLCVDLIFPKN